MKRTTAVPVYSREDNLMADLVSERLSRASRQDRSTFLRDTIALVLEEQGYHRYTPEGDLHYRAICSILGRRGGQKKPKRPHKAVLVAKAGELFSHQEGLGKKIQPVVEKLSVSPVAPKYRPPTTPFYPSLTPDMPWETRVAVQSRRGQLWSEMMLLARLRHDDLVSEADGD